MHKKMLTLLSFVNASLKLVRNSPGVKSELQWRKFLNASPTIYNASHAVFVVFVPDDPKTVCCIFYNLQQKVSCIHSKRNSVYF